MKYVIHAYEQSYGGLHGIEDWRAVESDCYADVEQEAIDMSIGVMESYAFIQEEITSQACFYCGCDVFDVENGNVDEEEFDSALNEAINENVAYEIWEVEDSEFSILEINNMLSNDPEGFVEEHCQNVKEYC
jgi:hypothetical protein